MIKRKGPLEALRKIDRAKINSCFRRSGSSDVSTPRSSNDV